MKENLEISSALDASENKKAYDAYCKKILSNKQILSHVIKGCVSEFKDIDIEDIPDYIEGVDIRNDKIKGMNVEDESVLGAKIQYDILFKITSPDDHEKIELIINVEAQNQDNPGYNLVSRAIYYCGRLIDRQKNANDGFNHSDFDDIKKVYSIWICLNHDKTKDDSITKYYVTEECVQNEATNPKESYDLFTVVMLYPSKEYNYEDGKSSLLEMLNVLFSSELSANFKKEKLIHDYGILMTKEIDEEVDNVCNLSEGVFNDGVAKGIQQGIQQGKQEGVQEAVLSAIIKMKDNLSISTEKAMDILEIQEDERPIYLDFVHKMETNKD